MEEPDKDSVQFQLIEPLYDLSIISAILEKTGSIEIYAEFEVEPFCSFSTEFQAEYWYLKYQLSEKNSHQIIIEDFNHLFKEKNLNIIWLSLKDDNGFELHCKDGSWNFKIASNHILYPMFENFIHGKLTQ